MHNFFGMQPREVTRFLLLSEFVVLVSEVYGTVIYSNTPQGTGLTVFFSYLL